MPLFQNQYTLITIQSPNGGSFAYDATLELSYDTTCEMSASPIDTGRSINDNVFRNNYMLRMRVIVTNTPSYANPFFGLNFNLAKLLGQIPGFWGLGNVNAQRSNPLFSPNTRAAQAFALSTALVVSPVLVSIQTILNLYRNMKLMGIHVDQDVSTANCMVAELYFKEAIIVSSSLQNFASAKDAYQATYFNNTSLGRRQLLESDLTVQDFINNKVDI